MNGLNPFERSIKDSLEPYEVPYNSADWAQLERSLDQGSGSGRVNRSGLYALLIGGGIAAISTVFVLTAPVPSRGSALAGNETVTLVAEDVKSPILIASQERSTVAPSAGDLKEQPSSTTRPTRPLTNEQEGSNITTTSKIVAQTIATPAIPAINPSGSTGPLVRSSITQVCPGTLIEFAAENLPDEGIYLWNFGDGSFSNKPTPNHAFSKSGSFEVMLSHSSRGGGNIHNKPAGDRIIIFEAPEASFNALKQEYDNTVPSVHFENRSLGGKVYEWDFGDGSTSTVAHPDHVYKKGGLYHISLTVTNSNGCVDRTERSVRIDSDYDLFAPKTFSPNGDGVDDIFMPEALKTLGVKFHLSIFEAGTGQLVYETSDPQRPWNGRMNNRGEACVSGDYVWMVEMKDGEKLGGTYNGSLDLMR